MTTPRFTAHDIPDLLNALPTLFGFTPTESIVAVATSGRRHRMGFRLRMDLPPAEHHEAAAQQIAMHLARQGAEGAILIAVSARPEIAGPLVRTVERRLGRVRPVVSVWADGERYWTTFDDSDPDGYTYTTSDHHLAVVQAIAEGQEILPDRAALETRLSPVDGPRRLWLDRAADTVMTEVAAAVSRQPDRSLEELALDDVGAVIERGIAGGLLTDGELLRAAVWTSMITVRDDQWERIDPDNASEMHRFWTHVARHAPNEIAAAPWCLSAFAAWLDGNGTSALIAAERAASIDPDYSMATLILQVLENGLSPRTWSWRSGEQQRATA